eukprot:123471-Pyramimonas_sp.AAC.1
MCSSSAVPGAASTLKWLRHSPRWHWSVLLARILMTTSFASGQLLVGSPADFGVTSTPHSKGPCPRCSRSGRPT